MEIFQVVFISWITPSFWLGFTLALICIFQLEPLSTDKIEYLKAWDDLLL